MSHGLRWVLGIDIVKYFDSIPHSHLRAFLDRRVTDGVIRSMIDKWLKVGWRGRAPQKRRSGSRARGDAGLPRLAVVFRGDLGSSQPHQMTALVSVAERMQTLRELHEAMAPGQRSRLNSPITGRQRVEAILLARQHGVDEETVRASPVALLKEQLTARDREIAAQE